MAANSTSEEILTAAGEVLAAEGVEGFTTAAVAEEAGVSQGLVHHYFETKHDLLHRLFEWGWEKTRQDIRELTESDDPRDRLLTFADYLITAEDQLEERLSVARIDLELRARSIHDEALRAVFDQWRADMLDIATQIIEDGIEQGQFRPVDVDRFAPLFVSVVVDAEQLFAIYGESETSQPVLEGLTQVIDEYLVTEKQGSDQSASR